MAAEPALIEPAAEEDQAQYGGSVGRIVHLDKWQYFQRLLGRPLREGDEMPYELTDTATRASRSIARFRFVGGGARAGKSRWCAAEVGPVVLAPRTKGWIVAPKYELGQFEFDYLIADLRRMGVPLLDFNNNARSGHMFFRVGPPIGSTVQVKSAKIGHEAGLLGEELDWVIMAEAPNIKKDIWERYIRGRLRSRNGIALISGSPKGTQNWTAKVVKRMVGDPEYASFAFDADDNPGNEERSVKEREFTEQTWLEQVKGIAASASGMVYADHWSVDRCVIDMSRTGKWTRALRKWGAMDWGYRDPTVLLIGALIGKGKDTELWIRRGYKKKGRTTENHARHVKRICNEEGRVELLWCDHDPERVRKFRSHGLTCKRAKKGWERGVEILNALMEQGRLKVDVSLKDLIEAIPSYEYAEDEDGPARNQDDHDLDTLRYLAAGLFWKSPL